MKTKKRTSKKNDTINPKNYLYSVLILLGGILLALYIFKWYQVKKEEKLMTSYLISTKTVNLKITNLDMLKQIMQEAPSSYFIYFSYTGTEEVYKFERELKRIIDKYKLNDIFYYVDLTDIQNNDNYLSEINKTLEIKLENIPAIIYVNDGKITEDNVLDGINNTMLKIDDLEQLLNIYEFETIK